MMAKSKHANATASPRYWWKMFKVPEGKTSRCSLGSRKSREWPLRLTIIFRLPESRPYATWIMLAQKSEAIRNDNSRFSKTHPSGISILWPSLATTKWAKEVLVTAGLPQNKRLRTNDGPAKSNISPEVDVSRHRQVVQINDFGDLLETFLEVLDLQMSNY